MIILSNNQWKNDLNLEQWAAQNEDCSAEARVDGLVKAYLEAMPAVIGIQESSEHMLDLLLHRLNRAAAEKEPGAVYSVISGRDTPILYRSDLLKLTEAGFTLFPEHIPGLEGSFNNSETKSYCWGLFEERSTGKRLICLTVHLWWKTENKALSWYQAGSDAARTQQLKSVTERMDELIARYGCPGLIMGDFNTNIRSEALKQAYADGWTDVHDLCTGEKDETAGYHHCSGDGYRRPEPKPFAEAIDHILLKSPVPVKVLRFARIMPEWFDRISDHYPLYTDIEF